MKLCIAALACCVVFVQCRLERRQDFLFGGLFANGCKTDADCNSHGTPGCCVDNGHGHHQCWHHFLKRLDHCHLTAMETHNCGCGTGMYCADETQLASHIAIEGGTYPGYGRCEYMANYTTTQGPMIAVEGGR